MAVAAVDKRLISDAAGIAEYFFIYHFPYRAARSPIIADRSSTSIVAWERRGIILSRARG